MKNSIIKNKTEVMLFVVFFCLCGPEVIAQGPPPPPPPPTTPINGLIVLALAMGTYLGAKKLRKNKKL